MIPLPKEGHCGFVYDPEEGRLFMVQEIPIVFESNNDGKVRPYHRIFNGVSKACTHIIFFIMSGKWPEPGMLIDHKDGNPWNNTWDNLREASYSQNARNRQPWIAREYKGKKLEMGVEITPEGRFRVRVRKIQIGTFSTIEEANEAALSARKVMYGNFDYHQRAIL